MRILYISHCSPGRPDKGEKIRAHHFLRALARNHEVHLACLCRNETEKDQTLALSSICASVFVDILRPRPALAQAGLKFGLLARSVTEEYFRNHKMSRHLRTAPWASHLDVSLVYSAAMAHYAPAATPLVLDLCDLDSEKWFEYARLRRMGWVYGIEGRRLREVEERACRASASTILMTENEAGLVPRIIPRIPIEIIANGVDFDFWLPGPAPQLSRKPAAPSIAFVGQLDYFPNSDGVAWFAREIFPHLRRSVAGLEFVIAGRNPGRPVLDLAQIEGIRVAASPDDVRPIIECSSAVVTPLRLARGLQNKVLEALAMGKRVLATPEVTRTFGGSAPVGVRACASVQDWTRELRSALASDPAEALAIRESLKGDYTWSAAAAKLESSLHAAAVKPKS